MGRCRAQRAVRMRHKYDLIGQRPRRFLPLDLYQQAVRQVLVVTAHSGDQLLLRRRLLRDPLLDPGVGVNLAHLTVCLGLHANSTNRYLSSCIFTTPASKASARKNTCRSYMQPRRMQFKTRATCGHALATLTALRILCQERSEELGNVFRTQGIICHELAFAHVVDKQVVRSCSSGHVTKPSAARTLFSQALRAAAAASSAVALPPACWFAAASAAWQAAMAACSAAYVPKGKHAQTKGPHILG